MKKKKSCLASPDRIRRRNLWWWETTEGEETRYSVFVKGTEEGGKKKPLVINSVWVGRRNH